jgi:hypothetical protein
MTVAYRPLDLLELAAIVKLPPRFQVNLPNLRKLVAKCGSFLTINEDTIYFIHQSAKDFFASDPTGKLGTSFADYHRVMFSRSLTLLRKKLRRDTHGLETELGLGVLIDEVPTRDPNPLASCWYACVYWVDHLRDSAPLDELRDDASFHDGGDIDDFFKTKYVYWLEALSLARGTSQGIMAIRKLRTVLVSLGSENLTIF